MTLEPGGINRRDQLSFLVAFIFLVAYHFIRLPCIQFSHMYRSSCIYIYFAFIGPR